MRDVAHSSRPACVSDSRPSPSLNQIAPYPSCSNSAAASRTFAAGWGSKAPVQIPIGLSGIEDDVAMTYLRWISSYLDRACAFLAWLADQSAVKRTTTSTSNTCMVQIDRI